MANKTMSAVVLQVVKTTAEWGQVSDVIKKGLLCIETTTSGAVRAKVGDGKSTFAHLKYLQDGTIDISNYYTKTQTDSAISTAIGKLGNIMTVKGVKTVVSELPATNNKVGDVYLVSLASSDASNGDAYAEYVWTEAGKWEYIGNVQKEVDLSGYAKTADVNATTNALGERITTLEGTSHSHTNKAILDATTASFTTALKTKYDALKNYDDTALKARVKAIEDDYIKSTDVLELQCTL